MCAISILSKESGLAWLANLLIVEREFVEADANRLQSAGVKVKASVGLIAIQDPGRLPSAADVHPFFCLEDFDLLILSGGSGAEAKAHADVKAGDEEIERTKLRHHRTPLK